MRTRTKISSTLVVLAVVALAQRHAAADMFTWADPGVGGEWTTAGNWSENDYPKGMGDVANFNLGANLAISVASPVTVGQIKLNSGGDYGFDLSGSGQVAFDNGGAANDYGTSGALLWRQRTTYNPSYMTAPIELADDLTIRTFTRKEHLDSPISGTGKLTMDITFSKYGTYIGGTSPNTYSGGTQINWGPNAPFSGDHCLFVDKPGAFGKGNVYLNDKAWVNLRTAGANADNVIDMIDDSAAVFLVTGTGTKSHLTVPLGYTEEVRALYIDGALQPGGTYGGTGSGAEYELDYFNTYRSGSFANGGTNGFLRVASEPSALRLLIY